MKLTIRFCIMLWILLNFGGGDLYSQEVIKIGQLPVNQLKSIRFIAPVNDGGIVFVSNIEGSKQYYLNRVNNSGVLFKSLVLDNALIDSSKLNNTQIDVVQNVNGEIWLSFTRGNINQNPQIIIKRFSTQLDFLGEFSQIAGNGFRRIGEAFPTSDSSVIYFFSNSNIRSFKLMKIGSDGTVRWLRQKSLGINAAAFRRVKPQAISSNGGITYDAIFPSYMLLTFSDPNKYTFQAWEYNIDGVEVASFNRVLDYLTFDIDANPSMVDVRKSQDDYQFFYSFFSVSNPFVQILNERLSKNNVLLERSAYSDDLLYLPDLIKHRLTVKNRVLSISNKHLFFRNEDGKDINEVIPIDNPYYASVDYRVVASYPQGGWWIYGIISEDNGQLKDVILRLPDANFLVQGNAFEDLEANCNRDSTELEYGNRWVCFKNDFRYFAWIDSNGFYKTYLPADTFQVSVTEKGKLWKLCDSQSTLILNNDKQHDLPLAQLAECPDLFVDVNIPFLVRCDTNEIQISYKNPGTIDAKDVFISLELDSALLPINASLPLIPLGNNQFNIVIGDIPKDGEGEIVISAYLDCDNTISGETHCVKAHIFPDSICTAIPSCWDGENYVLEAFCDNDTVYFRIKNEGIRPPSRPRPGTVLEDDIMKIAPIDIFLQPGQDTLIAYASNGKTIRFELPNDGCFPFPNFPSITVEGCGGIADTGFVITLPQNDEASFLSEWCVESTDSKPLAFISGNPKGYGSEKYITDSTQLEYTIFFSIPDSLTNQKFYIIDSMSAHLDISSIELGHSKLPYNYVIYNNGIVRFDFDAVSQKVDNSLKFKAAPRKGTLPGTKLYNKAVFYFDNQSILSTNKIFHTVGEAFLIIDISTAIDAVKDKIAVNVFPNPFATQFRFDWNNQQAFTGDEWLNVYDLHGKLIYNERIDASGLNVETAQWQKGMYFWQLTKASNVLATGKIVRQ